MRLSRRRSTDGARDHLVADDDVPPESRAPNSEDVLHVYVPAKLNRRAHESSLKLCARELSLAPRPPFQAKHLRHGPAEVLGFCLITVLTLLDHPFFESYARNKVAHTSTGGSVKSPETQVGVWQTSPSGEGPAVLL